MSDTLPARRLPWAAMVLGLAGLALLIGLGSWQMNRLAWKDALLASIEQRTHAAPRPIAEIDRQFSRDGDVEYWPVEAMGAFLHDKERHFLATFDGQSGFFVYTPLGLADGRVVFVNRGFVPYDRKEATTRVPGQVAGLATINGLARNPLPARPSSIVPDNEPDKNVFYWKDLRSMATSAGVDPSRLLPFFIDAGPAANPGGLPVGGVTIVDLPNNHLQYAVTWYGLAAALAGVLGALLWRRRDQART